MSNILDVLKTNDSDIIEDSDTLGGRALMDSDVYLIKIKHAFLTLSPGKALALNIHAEGPNGEELKQAFYMTSGEAKGCKNFYLDNQKKKHYLPGYNQANAICLLTIGKEIKGLDTQKKTINLYDFAANKEIPTEVDMIMELIDQEILAGVLNQIEDKKKKDESTGNYEPTGETKTTNEIDKFFRKRDKMTVVEIKGRMKEPVFIFKWLTRWKGEVKDKTSKKGAVKSGSPKRQIGKQAPTTDMFQ